MSDKARIGLREVGDAADAITARGKPTTIRAVQDALGGRGSLATISKYLQAWQRGERPEPEREPDALAERLDRIAAEQQRQASMLTQMAETLSALMRLAKAPKAKKRPAIITEHVAPPPTPPMPKDMPETFPGDPDALRRVALSFVTGFSGARKAETVEGYLPHYIHTLASMRRQGASTAQAWDAFDKAMSANGKPLFGAQAKAAFSHLPGYKEMRQPVRRAGTGSPD